MKTTRCYCSCLIALALCTAHPAAQTISVDAGTVIKTFDHNTAAINVDYLMDDDTYLRPAVSLTQSLRNMGAGALRFPGGEKSDNYLWSISPWTAPNPHFAMQGTCAWPNSDRRFSNDGVTLLGTTMDFDEFIAVCNSIGARPLIVVSGDANYNTDCPTKPTLASLIQNAVEWIKYANKTKKYGIKYWMVGNESWNSAAESGAHSTAQQYADDFVQFSRAMKAVDSTIVVVANSQEGTWATTLIQTASADIDAIAISNYPISGWSTGYERFRTSAPGFTSKVNSVVTSIGTRDIDVIVAEYNAIDWGGGWASANDLGHALVNFQMHGDQLKIPKVVDAYLWNTRWLDNQTSPQHLYDAIDAGGNLNATGKAMAMWGKNIRKKLVSSTNSGYINSFASVDSLNTTLSIMLLNKDLTAHTATVNVTNFPGITAAGRTVTQSRLTGTSVTDKAPVITAPTDAVIAGSTITVPLPALSINVVTVRWVPSTAAIDRETPLQRPVASCDGLVTGNMRVRFDLPLLQPVRLTISNSNGRTVHSQTASGGSAVVDLSPLSAGTYLVSAGGYRRMIVKY